MDHRALIAAVMNLFVLGLGYLFLGVRAKLAVSLLVADILLELFLPLVSMAITLPVGVYLAYDAYKIAIRQGR